MYSKKYKRTNTNTTISIFYEQNMLKKYNYDPPYQRDYNVWDQNQKSFLIDSIMKNFPMPPIFLQQIIEKGKTHYDVIDGKQRLTTIIEFIDDKIKLPDDFGSDSYGSDKINGLKFSELEEKAEKDEEIKEYLDNFWSYTINIEYIEKPDEKVVDNIFDRLNRGGKKLNPTELRKAKYYDTPIYQEIYKISKNSTVSTTLSFLDPVRMENIEFITEIFLSILNQQTISGEADEIDKQFKNKVDLIDNITAEKTGAKVLNSFSIFNKFELDLNYYFIMRTSHLYALIYMSYCILESNITIDKNLISKLNEFYTELRNDKTLTGKVNE